jgi:hypothetical protein
LYHPRRRRRRESLINAPFLNFQGFENRPSFAGAHTQKKKAVRTVMELLKKKQKGKRQKKIFRRSLRPFITGRASADGD